MTKEKFDINNLTHYIDQNLATLRTVPYAIGTLGLILIARSFRLFTKFVNVDKIPASFFDKNVQIKGVVQKVHLDGTLSINHSPVFQMPWHKYLDDTFLSTRLAFVTPTDSGINWMKLNLVGKSVKIKLLSKQDNELIVLLNTRIPFSRSLNEILIKEGLAQLEAEPLYNVHNSYGLKLLTRLKVLESRAKKNGAGLWIECKKTWIEKLLNKIKIN